MEKLSVTIITKNEEANLPAALASVSFADQTVVVDSGSTDRTVQIAAESSAKVIVNEWPGHVAQKNFAVDQAEHEWILSIDADERISDKLADQIRRVLDNPEADCYRVRRKTFYLGRWIKHCGWYPDYRIRLFNRNHARWGGIDPHDIVESKGKVADLDGEILHYSYRDISDHLKTIDFFTGITARRFFEKGRRCRLWHFVFHPPFAFLQKYFLKLGFMDGRAGLIICLLHGYYVLVKYAKLWELQRTGEK